MKQIFAIAGTLLVTTLIVVLLVLKLPARGAEPNSTPDGSASNPAAELPTATVGIATQPSEPERVVIPPHTVNGYTASIESYSIDLSHVNFQLRIRGENFDASQLGYFDIHDEYGNLINSSVSMGPAVDPELIQISFVPVTFLKGDRFKGQLAFNIYEPSSTESNTLAKFSFDLDLPIYPEVRFYPRQTVSANGMEMLVDSVTVTPLYTQVYLCFQPPSNEPWTLSNETVLQLAGKEATPLYNSNELFSSFTGSYWGTHSEPDWVPPVKNGSCHKIGFQTGTVNPTSLTLTIPDLENLIPLLQEPIPLDTLYPGLSRRQAFHTYLEENGYTYKGPWVFELDLIH